MVRSVERFKAELKALPLRDVEILDRREIQVPNPGTGQNVAPHVAEVSGCHIGEGSKVEPLVGALLIGGVCSCCPTPRDNRLVFPAFPRP